MEISEGNMVASQDRPTDQVENASESNCPAEDSVNANARGALASAIPPSPTSEVAVASELEENDDNETPMAAVDSTNETQRIDVGARFGGIGNDPPRYQNQNTSLRRQRQQQQQQQQDVRNHYHPQQQQQQQQHYRHQPTEENTTEDDNNDDYFYDEQGLVQQQQNHHQYPQENDSNGKYNNDDHADHYLDNDVDKKMLEGRKNRNYDNSNINHLQEEEDEDVITPSSSPYCSSTTSPSSSLRRQQEKLLQQRQEQKYDQWVDTEVVNGNDNLQLNTHEQNHYNIDDNHDGIIEEDVRRQNDMEEQDAVEEGICHALSDMQLVETAVREDALVISHHNALHHHLDCLDVFDNDNDVAENIAIVGENEMMALTVLPPNELSTTSAEAAMAASTFADMLGGGGVMGGGGGHGGDGFSGEGMGIGEERGIWIDEHGVHHPMMGVGVGSSGLGGASGGVGNSGIGMGRMAEEDGEDLLLGRGMGVSGDNATGLYGRMRREGPPGLVVDDSGVVRKASSIRVSPMSSSRGGGGGGSGIAGNSGVGMMMGSGGGINSGSSGWQGLYHGLHSHLHDSAHEGGEGLGSAGRGGDGNTMSNCGGMGVCGGDPLSSPRMDPIGVDVDDTASEEEDDEDDVEEEEEDDEDSSEISASDEDGSWIEWFCGLRGNEFFCEVDEDYIQDDFNLTGLYGLVPCYERALDMVLDVEMPNEDTLTEEQHEIVESAAEMLYGMIHARYIVTSRGMNAMYEKYRSATFGRCPHVYCQGQPVLPVGLSDMPRNFTVNVFCPRCHGLFFPKSTRQANVDGAYFGTTFPHLYLMTHPEMIPVRPSQQYVPRVYGFRINQSSLYYRYHEGADEENPDQNDNRTLTRSSRSRQR